MIWDGKFTCRSALRARFRCTVCHLVVNLIHLSVTSSRCVYHHRLPCGHGCFPNWPPSLCTFLGLILVEEEDGTDPMESEHIIIRQRSHPFITLPCCLHVCMFVYYIDYNKNNSRQQQIVPEPIPGTHVLLLLLLLLLLLWATSSSSIV